jgi:hypothetical protein
MVMKFLSILILLIGVSNFVAASDLGVQIHPFVENGSKGDPKQGITRELVVGETLLLLVAAFNLQQDEEGMVNAKAEINIASPSGDLLFPTSQKTDINRKLPLSEKGGYLDPVVTVIFDETDALGQYIINVNLVDIKSGKESKSSTSILLFGSEEEKNLILSPVRDAKHLDKLWGVYFKTGNIWALKSIIRVISLKNSTDANEILLGSAAHWSVKKNARDYPGVLSECKNSIKYAKGNLKDILEKLIADVSSNVPSNDN